MIFGVAIEGKTQISLLRFGALAKTLEEEMDKAALDMVLAIDADAGLPVDCQLAFHIPEQAFLIGRKESIPRDKEIVSIQIQRVV
jgi:hypothetical protein